MYFYLGNFLKRKKQLNYSLAKNNEATKYLQ